MDAVMAEDLTSHDRVVVLGQTDNDLMQQFSIAILRGMHSDLHNAIEEMEQVSGKTPEVKAKHRLIWNFVQGMSR